MRVAVIGTGIAGNAAAWTLSKNYPVTVYEREIRPGGHSHTVAIDYDGTQLAVDIGFIVYNELNYPELTALFAHLDIETVESCMSFAVTADSGRFEWKGGGSSWRETAQGLFAQAAKPAVAVISWDAARHPHLQHAKRRGLCGGPTGRSYPR
jgi:predicted NAD/FAD-binding protein